jgi:hypothetical protein
VTFAAIASAVSERIAALGGWQGPSRLAWLLGGLVVGLVAFGHTLVALADPPWLHGCRERRWLRRHSGR